MDGFANARKRAATACDPLHRLVDIGVGWVAMAIKQRRRGDQLSALTIATLDDVVFEPRFLQRASFRAIEPFDGDDTRIVDCRQGSLARRLGDVIEQDRASAAHADAATELGPRQFVLAPERPEQRSVCGRMQDDSSPVNTD